jgi:hypothetical protein
MTKTLRNVNKTVNFGPMKHGQNWAKNDMLPSLMLAPWILISAEQSLVAWGVHQIMVA